MEIVSTKFREQEYSGEALYKCHLTINNTLIPIEQIANIKIKSPIIDTTSEMFYIGTFISQTLTIKFKNLDGIDIQSNYEVELDIGQDVYDSQQQTTTEEIVPIGVYLIDDLAENYQTTCEITCMDYAIKFKPNIDYSPCFVDNKANVNTIIEYICQYFGVTLATDLDTLPNGDIEVGTYDSTVSGKQWLSYLAEIKGCNLKINRNGELIFIPFKKDEPDIEIDALKSAEFELGEKYEISQVVYFDAIRNYTYGDDSANTLFIRQDNPFITDTNVVKNIYDSLLITTPVTTEKNTELQINLDKRYKDAKISLYGNTYQKSYSGKNLLPNNLTSRTVSGITLTKNSDGTVLVNGTATALVTVYIIGSNVLSLSPGTYTLSGCPSGGSDNTYRLDINDGATIPEAGRTLRDFGSGRTFTLSSSLTINNIRIRIASGTTINNLLFKPMIEKGTSKTEYEPYVGGIPSPNPDYPQNIETVTGRNEIEISSGNLLKVPDSISQNFNGLTFTLNEDGGVTITGTSTQNGGFNLELDTPIVLNGDYTFSLKCVGTISQNTAQQWLLRDSNNASVGLNPQVSSNLTSYNTANINKTVSILRIYMVANTTFNCTIYPQLESGTQYTDYKQYKGIQSYEINLGKNLCNGTSIASYVTNAGVITSETSNRYISTPEKIKVKPNTTYTITFVGYEQYTNMYVSEWNNNTFISRTSMTGTFTTSSTTNYVYVHIFNSNAPFTEYDTNIQLEQGSNATPFSPYKTPIELCKIGNYQDYFYKDNGEWYLHKEIGEVVLDGSETWTKENNSSYSSTILRFKTTDITDIYSQSGGENIAIISSHFEGVYLNVRTKNGIARQLDSAGINVFIDKSYLSGETINDFKTWLSTHNTKVYYVLTTPTVTILDDELQNQLNELEENIELYEGINHITTNTNNLMPYLKLDYTSIDLFKIWSLKNKNYGDISLDAWDLIQFNLGTDENNNPISYQTYNDNTLTYEMNIATEINTQIPTKQKEVTTNVVGGNTDTKIKRLRTSVNAIENELEIVVEEQDELTNKVSELTIAVDEIEAQISDIPTITTEAEGTGTLSLLNLANIKLISLKVHPTTEDIIGLFASNELKVRNGLTTLSRGITFEGKEKLYYLIPKNLYFYNDTYDEFIYNGVEEKIYVIHRIGFDANDNKYVLETPIIEELEYQDIIISEGNNSVYMDSYPSAYIYINAMLKNDYTSTFATKIELNSSITQTTSDINLQVSRKVDDNKVIASINLSPEKAEINANKISLAGKDIDLTADNIKISSTKFNVDENGNLECNDATMNNTTMNNATMVNATVSGDITATTGKIGGYNILGDTLYGSQVGMDAETGEHYAFWAGANVNDTVNAPFRVGHDGSLRATNADISGTINASSGIFNGTITSSNGTIGTWSINNDGLSNANGFYIDNYSLDWAGTIYNVGVSNIYTMSDILVCNAFLSGQISGPNPGTPEFAHYDINGDGVINSADLLAIRNILNQK